MEKTARHTLQVGGLLNLWDKIELAFEERGRTGRYRTRLEDVAEDYLLIDRPSLVAGDALFSDGAYFTAYFFKPDSAYMFTGQILGKHEGSRDLYRIPVPRSIERNQRRRYFRIEVEGTVELIPADDFLAGRCDEADLAPFESTVVNISGNGVLVRTRYSGSIGQRLLIKLKLNDYKHEHFAYAIIRRAETDDEGFNLYGIEIFTTEEHQMLLAQREVQRLPRTLQNFTERQRTLLLNFIFTQQVALKKRGLL